MVQSGLTLTRTEIWTFMWQHLVIQGITYTWIMKGTLERKQCRETVQCRRATNESFLGWHQTLVTLIKMDLSTFTWQNGFRILWERYILFVIFNHYKLLTPENLNSLPFLSLFDNFRQGNMNTKPSNVCSWSCHYDECDRSQVSKLQCFDSIFF